MNFGELFGANAGKYFDGFSTGAYQDLLDVAKVYSLFKEMGVPIKFVYLCYSSSEKDWTNVVKEFDVKGEHHLLTGEQFAYFSNLFNISSAPGYVLIGRNGKIVNDNFVQPNSYQQYMQALRKYLGS